MTKYINCNYHITPYINCNYNITPYIKVSLPCFLLLNVLVSFLTLLVSSLTFSPLLLSLSPPPRRWRESKPLFPLITSFLSHSLKHSLPFTSPNLSLFSFSTKSTETYPSPPSQLAKRCKRDSNYKLCALHEFSLLTFIEGKKSESGCPSLPISKRKSQSNFPSLFMRFTYSWFLFRFHCWQFNCFTTMTSYYLNEFLSITINWMKVKKKLSIGRLVKSIHQARPSLPQVSKRSKFMIWVEKFKKEETLEGLEIYVWTMMRKID